MDKPPDSKDAAATSGTATTSVSLDDLQAAVQRSCAALALDSLHKLAKRPARRATLVEHFRRVCKPSRCRAYVLDPAEVADLLIERGAIPVIIEQKIDPTEEEMLEHFEDAYLTEDAKANLRTVTSLRRRDILIDAMNVCEIQVDSRDKNSRFDKKKAVEVVKARVTESVDQRSDLIQRLHSALRSAAPSIRRDLGDHPEVEQRILACALKHGGELVLRQRAVHHVASWVVAHAFVQFKVPGLELLSEFERRGIVSIDGDAVSYNLPELEPEVSWEERAIGCAATPRHPGDFFGVLHHPEGDPLNPGGWVLKDGEKATVMKVEEEVMELQNPTGELSHVHTRQWRIQFPPPPAPAIEDICFDVPWLEWSPHLRSPVTRICQVRVTCMVWRLIGPGGATVTALRERSRVHSLTVQDDPQGGNHTCTIKGGVVPVFRAAENIACLNQRGYLPILYPGCIETEIYVDSRLLVDIIGSCGAVIKRIQQLYPVEIDIRDDTGKSQAAGTRMSKITIAGSPADVRQAKRVIETICRWTYSAILEPAYNHTEVDVAAANYKHVIGSKGCNLRHIQSCYRVRVRIPWRGGPFKKVLIVGEGNQCKHAATWMEKMLNRILEEEKAERDERYDMTEELIETEADRAKNLHDSHKLKGLSHRAELHHEHLKANKNDHHRATGSHGQYDAKRNKAENAWAQNRLDKLHEKSVAHHQHEADKRKRAVARSHRRDEKYEGNC